MTTKIWRVVFDGNYSKRIVAAKSVAEAVEIATALFKRDTDEYVSDAKKEGQKRDDYDTWEDIVENGHADPTSIDLVEESEN